MSKSDLPPIDTPVNSKQQSLQAGRPNNKYSTFDPGLQFYCFTEDYLFEY